MATVGKLIKTHRLKRELSLRQLAADLGVTAAYISDLEADRRLPSADLKRRISGTLNISMEDLAAADSRLSPDLRSWVEERPQVVALLRGLRASPKSKLLIRRLTRLINRRSRPQTPRGFLVTWESELCAIASEASAWSVETGGDLFGRWHDLPTIYLATKAGPKAQRDHAHFRLDVEYLRELSETLAADWELRYFGDWHSHHRLGLTSPSGGDKRRIVSIAGRNQFPAMSEIIVTLEDSLSEPRIRINPWIYDLSSEDSGPFPLQVKILPGLSPIRQALIASRALPDQELFEWEKVPMHRVRIGTADSIPALGSAQDVDSTTRERTLVHLAAALQEASGHPVEQHSTGFGCVLVVRLNEPYYIAFALAAAWPMAVLEVHCLNRDAGTTDPLDAPAGLTALDTPLLLDVFRNATADNKDTV